MLTTYVQLIICCDPLFRVATFPHAMPMELFVFLIRRTLTSEFPTCPHHHGFVICHPTTCCMLLAWKALTFSTTGDFFYVVGWTRINPEIYNCSTASKSGCHLGPCKLWLCDSAAACTGKVIFVANKIISEETAAYLQIQLNKNNSIFTIFTVTLPGQRWYFDFALANFVNKNGCWKFK